MDERETPVECNLDDRIVVVQRYLFDRLISRARVGDHFLGSSSIELILDHVDKLNPYVAAERKTARKTENRLWHGYRRLADDIRQTKLGKTVFYIEGYYVRVPARLVGPGTGCWIELDAVWPPTSLVEIRKVAIWDVAHDKPVNFVLETEGEWKGCWVHPTIVRHAKTVNYRAMPSNFVAR